jgi:uncharacterized protein
MSAVTSSLECRFADPMRATARTIGLAVALLVPAAAAAAVAAQDPSFDCKGDLATVERVICTHHELAALDVELAAAYREALARAPSLSARKALQTDQARWRGRRNECEQHDPMQDCIATQYRARLAELRAGDGLSFLNGMVGRYPYEVELFDHPALMARLSSLMGPAAALVKERFQTSGRVNREGPFIYVSGNKQHSGGTDAGLLVADPATNQLWTWLTVGGKLQRFGPQADPSPMPRDAATMLSNIKKP